MTGTGAQEHCQKMGMRLPTDNEFRETYFSRITNKWRDEYHSADLSYWDLQPGGGFRQFTPGDGIFAFSGGKYEGNGHTRCFGLVQ